VPHREHAAQSSTAMTIVVTVVPKAARDALRLLDLERCTRRVDAKDGRRCAAQLHAARRRSVCRRVSERKHLRAPRTRARCNRRACISGGASGRGSTAAPQHRPPWLHPRPRPILPRRRRRGAAAAVAGSGGVSGDGPWASTGWGGGREQRASRRLCQTV
jgi:hypothetical protein